MDYLKIMQGMMFFVDDLTTDTSSCTYTSEYTPTKKRVWIVLSNNKTNAFGCVITMAPVYTRDKITLPTHVMYNDGDVSRVICVDQLTAIPRNMIDLHGFVGMLTPETWFRVKQALNLYFSESYTVSELSQTINTANTFTTKDLVCNTPVNNEVTDSKVTKTKLTVNNSNTHGKHMTIQLCETFYKDSNVMSLEELQKKYGSYGKFTDDLYVQKKRFAIKKRLEKAGIKV